MSGDIKVTFKRASVEATTEVGSFSELAGLIQDESSTLMKIFGDDMETVIQRLSVPSGAAPTTEANAPGNVETDAQRKKREKAEAREKAAALTATAVAPDPIPVPTAPPLVPTSPVDTTPNANGVPAFLERTAAGRRARSQDRCRARCAQGEQSRGRQGPGARRLARSVQADSSRRGL